MDFDLTAEQRLVRDSVERLMRERYDFEARRRNRAEPSGWSAAIWSEFADLGLLALPFGEADGGLGGGPVETMLVMEAFGRALVVEPYLSAIVTSGALLRHAASAAQRGALVPEIAAGRMRLAFAQAERRSRYDTAFVETQARRDGAGHVLSGAKTLVLHGDSADGFIVSARTAGAADEASGITLFHVPAGTQGVTLRGYPTQDGMRAADVAFENVSVGSESIFGEPDGGHAAIAAAVDETIAALCAEAVGAMAKMHDLTMEHLKTRRQFGAPIATFQVLQHRGADMYIHLEQARSMMLYAAMNASERDPAVRREAMSAAKVQIGRSGRFVGQQAVQLHGGVGVTMEYEVGHAFKRVTMIDLAHGDADHHLEKIAERGGLDERR